MKIAAVIPARGGSKGIPRKNMRLISGRPLISYAIENALACPLITDVIVTSDSDEILDYAGQFDGVVLHRRKTDLADDATTLDPVVYDAIRSREEDIDSRFDAIITLQPTSPLLSEKTLTQALSTFLSSDFDSVISAVNAPHLAWTVTDGLFAPLYRERLNRQQLPPYLQETGAFLITKRDVLSAKDRLGSSVSVFEVPEKESIDIDTVADWTAAEALLDRKRIAFRVDGCKELGLGHIYRALTLAYELIEHEIIFICNESCTTGIDKLRGANMNVLEIANNSELFDWLENNPVDIFVNDCLDTDLEYMTEVKQRVNRLVSFEDLGEGAQKADAVVNAIYQTGKASPNEFLGENYVCLRDEFLVTEPTSFSEDVQRILVMFGGTDPLDLSSRLYHLAKRHNSSCEKIRFDFILGSGYKKEGLVSLKDENIFIHHDVIRVSSFMKKADMAFSSQGRTTFELAAMGVPTIVIAQNERELLHSFAQMNNGFINLGLGREISDDDIFFAMQWLISAKSIRKEMHRLMLSTNLKSGIDRVKRIILGEVV